MFSNQPKKFTIPNDPAEDISTVEFLSALRGEEQPHPTANHSEGQLAVDVVQTESEIIIIAPMAGTVPGEVELHLHNDVLTIRGERRSPIANGGAEYFYEECFWGKFSRTIVLPTEVKAELARADYKNGVLVISLPKARHDSSIPIYVVDE